MRITRRCLAGGLAGLGAGSLADMARAEDMPHPFVVYDDELKNGWQNYSWATVTMSVPLGKVSPIKVEGGAWSALALHHAPFSTQGFRKLSFYINGGVDGGQSLMIKPQVDGKILDILYVINLKARTWALAEIPLKDIGAQDKTIDGFAIQAQADGAKPFYIAKIQFE